MRVELRGVTKRYSGSASETVVFDKLELTLAPGDLVGLLGDNGCGKTTLLTLVAGLTSADEGRVLWDGATVPPKVVGYCPQDYAASLLPWFRVWQNVALPLRFAGRSRAEAAAMVEVASQRFGITLAKPHSRPEELSGGYQQRAALARALAVGAELVALDEPFASQDTQTAERLASRIPQVLSRLSTTAIAIFHDVNHALLFANRVIVLAGQPARVVFDRQLSITDEVRDVFSAEFHDLKREIHRARASAALREGTGGT